MNVTLVLQNVSGIKNIPGRKLFKTWVTKALDVKKQKKNEIVIRIVGIKEIIKLNKQYRKKNKPTNIISFPFSPPPNLKTNFLGDIVICAPIVRLEAKLQHKSVLSRWAHLTVHGVLHLLGYDHHQAKAAQKMEKLEIKILKQLDFANPYSFHLDNL